MSKSQLIKIAVVCAALIAVVRFRNQLAGLMVKIPVVNKLAGVA